MAPKKKCKSKSNSAPKLNSVKSTIIKPKHVVPKSVRPAKRSLYLRRSVRLNPFPFVFGTHSPDLQAMIGRQILSNFNPIQQWKLRAVSPMWDYNVRLGCKQVRAMVLNFSNGIIWSRIWNRFPNKHVEKIGINMKEEELTHSTIDVIGKVYCNIAKLCIVYDSVQDAEKLFKLLRQFTKVTEFTLVIVKRVTAENFLPQLFATINDHLAPLTSLVLGFLSKNNETFPKLEFGQFEKTLSFLQGICMTFEVENIKELFELIGKNLPAHRPFQRLSVPVKKFELSQIAPMFVHNPTLSQVKKFELNIQSMDVLYRFMSHLPKLNCLTLKRLPELVEGRFTNECIRAIGKLVYLTKLSIENFQPMIINQLAESLPHIIELDVIHKSFFENIDAEWHLNRGEHVQPIQVMCKPFVENLAKQFPNLKEFTIKADLSKINGFRNEFIDLCLEEFSKLKTVNFL